MSEMQAKEAYAPTEMVQRLAKRIRGKAGEYDLHMLGYTRDVYDGIARAALEEMREPTEAMVQAGYDECEQGTDREMVANAWRAMCDEARR